MSAHFAPSIRIQAEDFDPGQESEKLTRGRFDIGAVVTFIGLCRDDSGSLSALELEHYPGMAEEEIARIAACAMARWPLIGLTVIHRYGMIHPGERIVLVATASAHRQAAFEAASFLMDFLKADAPFWKKEHRKGGEATDWVETKTSDVDARTRWNRS